MNLSEPEEEGQVMTNGFEEVCRAIEASISADERGSRVYRPILSACCRKDGNSILTEESKRRENDPSQNAIFV